jgi:5'-deoxynucleotidase YfbR-like HD superfamily hydrolase
MAGLSLLFGLITRATAHADGHTPESDTTHTHMLSMLVLEQAQAEGLDPLLCCALVQVHDLPELYAGDTDTAFGLTEGQRLDKQEREAAALDRLRVELAGTRVLELLELYERQDTREAQLVRLLDKITPKLTHMHNRLATIFNRGAGLAEIRASHRRQGAELERLYPWANATLALFWQACEAAEKLGEEVECERQVAAQSDQAPPGWRSWPEIRAAASVGEEICGSPDVAEVIDHLQEVASDHPANAMGEFISPRLLDVGLREMALQLRPGRQWLACMRRELGIDPGEPS